MSEEEDAAAAPAEEVAAAAPGFTDDEKMFIAQSGAGNPTPVRDLLKGGVNVNVQSPKGVTALHVACGKGHASLIQLLLDSGADPSVADSFGLTALHYAAGCSKGEVMKLIVTAGSACLNKQDLDGCTPLHYAAYAGFRAVTGILINAGADATIADAAGNTPEMDAKANSKSDVIARIQKGVDPADEGDDEPAKAEGEAESAESAP